MSLAVKLSPLKLKVNSLRSSQQYTASDVINALTVKACMGVSVFSFMKLYL